LSWPTKLYLAARNLNEFRQLKKKFKNKNIQEFIYWPTLSKKEGYWISPFSNPCGLKRIFQELEANKNKSRNMPAMDNIPIMINPQFY
jgi:hypothetical protein